MCPLPEIGTGAHPHCSVTTKTGDGRFVGIEHVALVGGESGQVGIGRAIVAKAGAAGFAGKTQRLHTYPPDGGPRFGLEQCQPLSLWLEKHRSQLPSSVRPVTVSNSRSKGWAYQKAVTSRMLTPASANGMHIVSLLDSVE